MDGPARQAVPLAVEYLGSCSVRHKYMTDWDSSAMWQVPVLTCTRACRVTEYNLFGQLRTWTGASSMAMSRSPAVQASLSPAAGAVSPPSDVVAECARGAC